MSTLMVTPFAPYRDGIATYAAQELRHLRSQGEHVDVLSPVPSAAPQHLPLGGAAGMASRWLQDDRGLSRRFEWPADTFDLICRTILEEASRHGEATGLLFLGGSFIEDQRLEQLGGAYLADKFHDAFFENPGFDNAWIKLKLVGTHSNRSAIGARIQVDVTTPEGSRTIYKHVNSGASFGANPLLQSIGLGKAVSIDKIEILWPRSGSIQVVGGAKINTAMRIEEKR